MKDKPKRRRIWLFVLIVPLLLCAALAIGSAISNRSLPTAPQELDRLTAIDTARVTEAFRIKAALGDQVWPGWGSTSIPIVVWNDEYRFLHGYEGQPAGWEPLAGEEVAGLPVYRAAAREEEQSFAEELVADVWVGSFSTKWQIDSFFISEFHDEIIPAPLNEVVPYRLFIIPTEQYVAGMLHETFHAYQAITARDRFDDAETAYRSEEAYWAADEAMRDGWETEIDTLIRALRAGDDAEARELAAEFLTQRAARREAASLSAVLIDYERRYEWLEGLAKYAEIGIFEAAAGDVGDPVPALADDPDFHGYRNFTQRYNTEIMSMQNTAGNEGDTRFYYTGMAQARLLDRLQPGWKDRVMGPGVWLEDLLAEAVAGG
ncbi:MAG: hypothetical protein Kow00124_25560 [Anaerolineae bacterium]